MIHKRNFAAVVMLSVCFIFITFLLGNRNRENVDRTTKLIAAASEEWDETGTDDVYQVNQTPNYKEKAASKTYRSYRQHRYHGTYRLSDGRVLRPMRSSPPISLILNDDFTYCKRTAPFVGPFDFVQETKNPCWWDGDTPRCLPYFFLAGFSKSGTSDLTRRLTAHPDIVMKQKEIHWLDAFRYIDEYRFLTNYTDVFPNFLPRRNKNGVYINNVMKGSESSKRLISRSKVTGDATPNYAWNSLLWRCYEGNEGLEEPRYTNADVIYRMNPKAKIIMIMRDPVKRLFSRYMSWAQKVPGDIAFEKPSSKHFHDKCSLAINEYNKCDQFSKRKCAYSGPLYTKVRLRLQEGMYSIFIKDWLKVFPRNQLLFLKFEDYVKDIPSALEKVFSFLELEPLDREKLIKISRKEKSNVGQHYDQVPEMWNSTKIMLQQFYGPFVQELKMLLGEQFTWGF